MDPRARRRTAYLAAMGIDVWVRRGHGEMFHTASAASSESNADARPEAWRRLAAEVASCKRCELHRGRTQTVFGAGNTSARCLVIGEAPGAEEDRRGEPFVGRAGQLLNAMLFAIGLRREDIYIANILKCRPPSNRDPKGEEVAACEPYLQRQIALLDPQLILAVGRVAAQNLLNVTTPIGKLRGQSLAYGENAIPVVVTYHPAYLLRSPGEKRKTYVDLLRAQALLQNTA